VLLLLIIFTGCTPAYHRYQAQIVGPFDTVTVLIGYAKSEADFDRYADIAFERLEALHRMYDIFNAYDGLNNLHTINAQAGIAPVEADQEIIDMLLAAREGYALTGGKTNIALGAVLRIWHDCRTRALADPEDARLPSVSALREADALTDMASVIIDEDNRTVFLRRRGMSLDVGSVAKGYAAKLVMDAAREAGLQSALLNVGGHVVAVGTPPGRDHWNIAVQNPDSRLDGAPAYADTLSLTDATVSVTGAYQRYYVADGQAFGTVIDPSTLMPAELYKQVTVIHPVSWMADVLSTALYILPLDEGMAMALENGAEVLWIDTNNIWTATPGYKYLSNSVYSEYIHEP
jgi:thiamine biosynthesis lipoprotein